MINNLTFNWGLNGTLIYELKFDEASPSNNVIKEMHFQVYKNLRKKWQMMVLSQIKHRPQKPIKLSFLEITRECAGGGLDWDNAYGGLKPILDCLVMPSLKNPSGLGLITDDNPKNMPFPPFFTQLPAPKNKSKTTIKIYEINLKELPAI